MAQADAGTIEALTELRYSGLPAALRTECGSALHACQPRGSMLREQSQRSRSSIAVGFPYSIDSTAASFNSPLT